MPTRSIGTVRAVSSGVLVAAILLALVGCQGAQGGRVLTAAERWAAALATMASRSGSTSDDVARSIKLKFPNFTETQLADEAESLVLRTSWVDAALARIAADRLKTAKAVRRATCAWLDRWEFISNLAEAERSSEFATIIRDELRNQGLPEDEQKVAEVWNAVDTQMESLRATGSIDVASMSSDLLCLLSN